MTLKLLLVAALSLTASIALATKPNIIIFYVDDLGWQDVEKLNELGEPCPYETPNLIKLAARGMNFSQAYSPAPTCAPSRAGIITGQHPAQMRYTHVTAASIPRAGKDNEFQEPFLGSYLDLDHLTLADALKQNGYRTGHFGKWHCGLNATAFGFHEVNQTRGFHRGMGDRTKDFSTPNTKQYPLSKEKYPPISEDFPEGISYPYDELTEEALKFIQTEREEPFFLNLCHWMVHWPMLTRNGELLEYYCKKLGQPFPPKPGAITLPGQQNPYFAAMTTSVDWSLGRVMEVLEKTDDPRNPGKKLVETTYLFFTSDNGGAELKGKEILSDNFPLKSGKKKVDEGGIRVPTVITGPGISAGKESATLVNQLDLFPTILNLTESKIDSASHDLLSGLDITPVLMGKSDQVLDANGKARESLFWHFPHNQMRAAIRKGDFKLYRYFTTETHSLYRLSKDGEPADIEEKNDLAADPEYAELKKELIAELNQSLKETKAELPHRNPNYQGAKLPFAKIESVSLRRKATQAELKLDPTAPKATEAYILYYQAEASTDKRAARSADHRKIGDPKIPYKIKVPAIIQESGHHITAPVPVEVTQIRFLIIDENNYQHFSEPTNREPKRTKK